MGDRLLHFEQMISWQKSTDFAVEVYKISAKFPESERFGITSQLRRAVASVPANIAEGFGRFTNKDKSHFYDIAYGSLLEVRSFLYLCNKLEYVTSDSLDFLLEQAQEIQKLINASKKALR